MTQLISSRNNDASNTIRGYVYQVDTTIKRWLELKIDERLELECGEDIDLISRSLHSEDEQRLLEQVKNYTDDISLWSSVGAIANFVEHRQSNPSVKLRYLFTTTASVKIERPSPKILKRQKGIEIWEKVRLGCLTNISEKDALIGILSILSRNTKPTKLSHTTWSVFRDFIQNTDHVNLIHLIHDFTWSTKSPAANSFTDTIPSLLIKYRYATDEIQSKEIYQRLFFYVFKRLSESGLKQLTKKGLSEQLTLPTLNESDSRLLDILVERLSLIENKVFFLENRVNLLEDNFQQIPNEIINQVNAQLRGQLKSQGIDFSINCITTIELGIPPTVEQLCYRNETISSLVSNFKKYTWIALNGISGAGKTQLTALVVQKYGNCLAWIRLRDLSQDQAAQKLDSSLRLLQPFHEYNNFRVDWYIQICESLKEETIFVLEDLPELTGNDELSERLIQLSSACSQYRIKIISTSSYLFPFSLEERLSKNILYITSAPPFKDSEVKEILQTYGASDYFTKNYSKFINNISKGHPQIIAAISRYLLQRNWRIDNDLEITLMRGEYQKILTDQTLRNILNSVENDNSRELLYRLCLPIGSFSEIEVQKVASINPALARSSEHLQRLVGPWIQRDINERLLVSPLVKPLGAKNLLPETRKSCHQALAELIISKRQLSPAEGLQAILHYSDAENFNMAGRMLVSALQELSSMDKLVDDGGLLSIWSNLPLPKEMDVGTCILIRGFQIVARHKYEKPISYLIEDLDILFDKVNEENALEILVVVIATNQIFCKDNPQKANRHFRFSLKYLPNIQLPKKIELNSFDLSSLGFLVWANSQGIKNAEQLQDWLLTVESLTDAQRCSAFSHELAEMGCLLISETVWMQEAEKIPEQQNWLKILQLYEELADRAKALKIELLRVCFVVAKIIIIGEFCQDLSGSVQLATNTLSEVSDDPRVLFLISQRIGQQYLNSNHNSEALKWLSQALGSKTNAYAYSRMKLLLNMSRAVGNEDAQLAVEFCQQAFDFSINSDSIDKVEQVRALCELSIAKWLETDVFHVLDLWLEAGEMLLACRSDSDFWKETFLRFGHVSGYFANLARTGKPPSQVLDNGERYAAPQRGMFLNQNSAMLEYYHRDLECLVLCHLSTFAAATMNDQQAAIWALRGIDDAIKFNKFAVVSVLSLESIPHFVLNGNYSEVLDLAIESGAFFAASMQLLQTEEAPMELDSLNINVESVLGNKSNSLWQKSEEFALFIGLLPIVFHLCSLNLNNLELAKQQSLEVSDICLQISNTSTNRQLWLSAAELIGQICFNTSSFNFIQKYNNSLGEETLEVLGHLVKTFQVDTSLQKNIKLHFMIAPFLFAQRSLSKSTYRRIILFYFVDYWKTQFEATPLIFNNNNLIRTVFNQLDSIPESKQLQYTLVAVALSLNTSIPPVSENWVINSTPELVQYISSLIR